MSQQRTGHGQPTLVAIRVERTVGGSGDGDRIVVEIADDGPGMADPANAGFGSRDAERVRGLRRKPRRSNEPDGGLTVTATLRAIPSANRPAPGGSRRAVKILVVDDHPIVRFRPAPAPGWGAGFDVREAASGREARSRVSGKPPDLVILDLSMPGLGGLEVMPRLRLEHHACILVLSMQPGSDLRPARVQAGAAGSSGKAAPADRCSKR